MTSTPSHASPFAAEHDALRDVVARVVSDLAAEATAAEQAAAPPEPAIARLRGLDLFGLDDILAQVAACEALGRLRSLGLVLVALDQMLVADVGLDAGEIVAVARRRQASSLAPLATAATVASRCLLVDDSCVVGIGAVEPVDVAALRGAGWAEVYVDVEHAATVDVSDGAMQRGAVREAAAVVASGWQAFDDALGYAKQRTAFGRPIGRFQANRHLFATVATHLEAAQALVRSAAWNLAGARDVDAEAAWRFAIAATVEATDVGLQMHGGYGYTTDFDIERAWRDVRALQARGAPS